jgi:hypothetical protein
MQAVASGSVADDIRAALQLRLAKMAMLEDSFSKVQEAARLALLETSIDKDTPGRTAFGQLMQELR